MEAWSPQELRVSELILTRKPEVLASGVAEGQPNSFLPMTPKTSYPGPAFCPVCWLWDMSHSLSGFQHEIPTQARLLDSWLRAGGTALGGLGNFVGRACLELIGYCGQVVRESCPWFFPISPCFLSTGKSTGVFYHIS